MSDVTEGVVELWNRNHYTNASRYAIRWELKEDDKVIQSGDLALSTAPLSQELVHIPYKKPAPDSRQRIPPRCFMPSSKKDELWAKAGHEVAWEELELPWSLPCSSEEKGSRRTFLFTFGERIGCLRRWLQICIQPYRRTTDVDGCSRYGTAGITAPAESLACPAGQ
ncbi:DUF4981 domain-containing protein [Bacteroides uniformis]|nr:DUF4981 domain-containing protein [Bacteroides uniformis]